MNLGNQPAL